MWTAWMMSCSLAAQLVSRQRCYKHSVTMECTAQSGQQALLCRARGNAAYFECTCVPKWHI